MNLSRRGERIAVIGAGAVGLACAQALARAGHEVYLLEAGVRIAEGVTSRNSGVIHSPLNYPPGSLKARLCARGRELLYDWCAEKEVPHRQTGKLVVATNAAEEAELQRILSTAHQNGAPEVRLISGTELKSLEPSVSGMTALFSPRTGIIDPYELSRSFLQEAESHGATLVLRSAVHAVSKNGPGFRLETALGEIECDAVVNSAGLQADEIAAMAGIRQYRIYPWRGDYFSFAPKREFQHLIYPVKMKSDSGLGVHLTMDLQGKLRLGPDAELVARKDDFSPREDKKEAFLTAAKKLFPWATSEMLHYDTCGIRPKLRGPSDTAEKDFIVSEDLPRWINLMGIESPGITASLAIAEQVCSMLA